MKRLSNPERSFGVSVGSILVLICAYAVWTGHTRLAVVSGGFGVVLVTLGLLRPSLLRYPSALWWGFAFTMGYINTRIVLTLAFFLVLVPLGLVWRLVGHDPLGRHRGSWPGWTPAPTRYRDRLHYLRMY